MEHEILVVITARGGSKGVPRKNIRRVNGKPLIAYAIEAALSCQLQGKIYKVIVSTDDEEIASVAKEYGADVPFMRPDELATDKAASLPVIQHAVLEIEKQDNITLDASLLIQPTNPLITGEDISNVVDLFLKHKEATSVVSVLDATDTHPLKMLIIENEYLRPFIDGASQAVRRQDLMPKVYKRNGGLYLTCKETLIDGDDLYGSNIVPYLMPEERSLDIDTEFDLRLAEFILRENANPSWRKL